jgi:uncharacterized protein YxeA
MKDMKKQVIIIAIIIFLISAGVTLITYNPVNTEKNMFVGTWNSDDDFFVFILTMMAQVYSMVY